MKSIITTLYKSLNTLQKRKLMQLQGLIIMMAVVELVAIASIGPFMGLVADPEVLTQKDTFLASLYQASRQTTPQDFLFLSGLGVLVLLVTATLVSMFTTWRLSLFSEALGAQLSIQLYQHYLEQDWLFHTQTSSAHLTKQIANETVRLTDGIIHALLQINAKLTLIALISLGLVLLNPTVAITALTLFSAAYILLYRTVRHQLDHNGQTMSQLATRRYQLINEGFGGIREAILFHRRPHYEKQFSKASHQFAQAKGKNNALSLIPRFLVELIAFGAMITLMLYLIAAHEGDLTQILPLIAIYALAGFKLLPALQQTYVYLTHIKGNYSAFEALKKDLVDAQQNNLETHHISKTPKQLPLKHKLNLNQISFTYPHQDHPALNQLTLEIKARQTVGIVGASGAGKSTLIDLMLGFIQPEKGELSIDGIPLTPQNHQAWLASIGLVPQHVFLTQASIAENIAFGLEPTQIHPEKLQQALKLAHLDQWVTQLPQGTESPVGERGIQISGGQRQRIGIARALYHNPEILIFDEATSSLDGLTEKAIMQAIHELRGRKTIVLIAHRLKTIQNADQIFYLEQGQVQDHGSYQDLFNRNPNFQKLAQHA